MYLEDGMGMDAGEAGKEKLKQFVRVPKSAETAFDSGRFGGGKQAKPWQLDLAEPGHSV
jgi:hypothetical protein